MNNNDHNTWVYHALKDAKIVKASEAKKLYKQGWRDSPDPKILFTGIRGKWYKLILPTFRAGKHIKYFWFAHWKWIVGTTLAVITLILGIVNLV